MKILTFTLLAFLVISCKEKINIPTNGVNYKEIYSIELKNKIIGYCTQIKNNYKCEIFLKNNKKKFSYKIEMQRNGNLVKYISPTVTFEKKIKSNYLIYPFLFENNDKPIFATKTKNIYYPENNKIMNFKDLSIKKIKNGYIASPFTYKKLNKIPQNITPLNILEFREIIPINTPKIPPYPTKYKITFNSNFLPPSNNKQICKRNNKKITCELSNSNVRVGLVPTQAFPQAKKEAKSSIITTFIKKHHLKKYTQKEDLIPNLIKSLHQEIKYQDISQKLTSSKILKLKKGDCTEFSQLSVDILQALNINSKRIYGLIYKPKKNKWLYHSWVEYTIGNKTYSFDPVNSLAYINLNYLKLGEENKYKIIIIPLDIDNLKFIEIN